MSSGYAGWDEVKVRGLAADPRTAGQQAAGRATARERREAYVRGHQLAEMRTAARLTQAELAHALGVSQARVSKIEHGEISGIDIVRAYVAALGGSIDVVARLGDRTWKVACPSVTLPGPAITPERQLVAIEVVFETHSTTVDNEQGCATGWLGGQLSARGQEQARRLGQRRRDDAITAVFTSDLTRATQTAAIAFAGSPIPVLHDWRLRECDYGQHTGTPAADLHASRRDHLDQPYPGGESWRQATTRVSRFLADLPLRWSGQRVLVIGHVATRWGLEHWINGTPLETLAREDFTWQAGWEYQIRQAVTVQPAPW